jgi:hypothetical protein
MIIVTDNVVCMIGCILKGASCTLKAGRTMKRCDMAASRCAQPARTGFLRHDVPSLESCHVEVQ